MCAKKEQAIKECKEKIQESHKAAIDKLDKVLAIMAPVKAKTVTSR